MKYGKPRIAWRNKAINSSLTFSSEDYLYPAVNILDSQTTKVWRSSQFNESTAFIQGTLPSLVQMDCYHLSGINISLEGEVTIKFYPTLDASGPPNYTLVVDDFSDIFGFGEHGYSTFSYSIGDGYGRDWARNQITRFLDRAITIGSWRVEFSDPSILEVGWFELGSIFFGVSWSPTYGITQEYSAGFQSENQNLRSRSGYLASQDVPAYKILNVPIQMMSEEEMTGLHDMVRTYYSKSPLLCGVFTRELSTDELMGTIYGSLVSPPSFVREASTRRFKTTLVIEEAK